MKKYILILILLHATGIAFSQGLLKGRVISDADRKPLSGATIKVLGTEIKTLSDQQGYFQVKVPELKPELKISYLGYRTAYRKPILPLEEVLIVSLRKSQDTLEEVAIHTGFQSIPKERATGSFSTLSNKRLNEQVGMNVLDRLPAIANSYLVTSPRTNVNEYITMRGFSTIGGPRGPLIILDNFPYEGEISNINPNDIESITLLKDAAAASIWGTRAGNGVVVITTKKGTFDQSPTIEFSTNLTSTSKPDLYAYKTISSSDYIGMEQLLFSMNYNFSDTADVGRPPFSPVYELLFRQRNGQLSETETNEQLDALKNRDVRDDFNRYIYQNGLNQQYAINMHGGGSSIAWLFSAGYDKNTSQLDEGNNRLNLRTQNSYRVNDKLRFTLGAYYTHKKSTSGKPGYRAISDGNGKIPPYSALADEYGNSLPIYKHRQGYIDTAGGGNLLDWNYYPLEDYKHVRNSLTTQDLLANAGLQYKLFKGFTADAKFQYEWQGGNSRLLQDVESYYTRNLINNFSQIDRTTGEVTHHVPVGGILDLSNSVLQAYNLRGQLNFDRMFSGHGISALAGAEIRQNKGTINNYRAYGFNEDILTNTSVDYANPYPQYITGWTAFIANTANFEGTTNRYVSVFGNIAYTYKDRYVLSASARNDASNIFGVSTNDKWRPLWSAGASWDLSKEPFYKLNAVPYLKLRATYGLSGNVDPSRSALTTIRYSSSASPYTATPITEVENYYNPELRWEKVAMFNAGVDFSAVGNRISGSIEYYKKHADDLYGDVPIDMTVGLSRPTLIKNTASMKGEGMDIELNTHNLQGTVAWASNLNFSTYHDEIVKSYTTDYRGSEFVGGGLSGLVGKPLYSLYSYQWRGLDPENGNPLGYINGHVSGDYRAITGDSTRLSDLVYNGTLIPTMYGSLGNTVSWKNISLTFRISYAFGHYFLKESINYSQLVSTGVGHSDYALRWQKAGDEQGTDIPSWVYPLNSKRDSFYGNSEILAVKGDNIRLRYINLAFDFPRNKVKSIGLSQLKVFCTVSNLGLLWRANNDHIDPDYPNAFNPPPKSISLGINAKF